MCLYEGLLQPTVSFSRRGMEDVVWGDHDGVVCRLDTALRVGTDVFVAPGQWYGRSQTTDALTLL
ncbi:MAG: hypothetical protein LUE17_02945 [Planctomycetaceae bacterium]|nr:hypothetical protein [Planctomycetaceae bacterium]